MCWLLNWYEEDDKHLMEDKRNSEAQKADVCWNYTGHIPPMSLLWYTIKWRPCLASSLATGQDGWQTKTTSGGNFS